MQTEKYLAIFLKYIGIATTKRDSMVSCSVLTQQQQDKEQDNFLDLSRLILNKFNTIHRASKNESQINV